MTKATAPKTPKAKKKADAPAAEGAPAPKKSGTIAGPGTDAVADKPRFAAKPPRNPFTGAKNPRLRDR